MSPTGRESTFIEGLQALASAHSVGQHSTDSRVSNFQQGLQRPSLSTRGVPDSRRSSQSAFPRFIHVLVSKGNTGFGFTLADTPLGQVVSQRDCRSFTEPDCSSCY